MSSGMFDQDAGTWVSEHKETRSLLPALAVAMVLLLGLVAYVAYAIGSAPVDGLTREREAAVKKGTALAAQVARLNWRLTHCLPYEKDVQIMTRLISHGFYGEAAAVGELDLRSKTPPACPDGIGRLWYESAMLNLYGKPAVTALDQTPVLAWDAIQHEAIRFGVQQDSPLTVFVNSYNNQNWPLAKVAYAEALRRRVTSTADRFMLAKVFAVYRNLGHALAFRGTGGERTAGVHLLATANAIGQVVHRFEAKADLQFILGANEKRWPQPDRSDPVLRAVRSQ